MPGLLSIVVPTIPGRESLLSRCLWSVTQQSGPVDILVVDGTGKLGDKLNVAYRTVDTMYVSTVDDDDWITADYVQRILPRLGLVDYVGFKFLECSDGKLHNISATHGDYPHWGIHMRLPVPKGVIRGSIARQVDFHNDYHADRQWARAVHALIKTCDFVDAHLYVHDWWGETGSSFHDGQHRDVGDWPYDETRVTRITVNA
jgi:hypothetical protein